MKKPLSPSPCNFEVAFTKRRLSNISKEVHFKAVFKDKMTSKEGAVVKSETVVVPMSANLLRKSLAILRSYAKVVMDGVDKRFMNSGVTDDAVHVFALEYIPKSAAHVEPRAALNRLAIFPH